MKRRLLKLSVLGIVATLLALSGPARAADATDTKDPPPAPVPAPIAKGPFKPDWESLKAYRAPTWFRDAKLGIWAHWGPQSVPMVGDWYARNMYIQDHKQNKHHVATYGHPTEFGYKDIIPLWKAEKWDPDRLMALYKKAGARYFVSMGVHHDNFDLWRSTHHKWNAVAMGPRRDIVGTWQQSAKKQGLRFGVSEHLGASYYFFQTSHRADKTGPRTKVSYDGADPKYQDLYHTPASPEDKQWYSTNPDWHRTWFARIKDLVDQYQPDLLYTDGGVPFGEVGRTLIAHFYNSNRKTHGGKLEAVYNCKQISKPGFGEFLDGTSVQDVERGTMVGINPLPWQTDTSIGDWFYNKDWKIRKADWVVRTLVDIVSKNGNLLLNVVQRPDGSLDPEVEQTLEDLASWMHIHGEAIYETRPWIVAGEGPTQVAGTHLSEDFSFGAQDIRFTTRGKLLYAFALGWPEDGHIQVKSLPRAPDTGVISKVTLLGHKGPLTWKQDADGLSVTLPAAKVSEYAVGLRIEGKRLRQFKVTPPTPATATPAPSPG